MKKTSALAQDSIAHFGKSQWIWPLDHRWDLHNAYVLFRHKFELTNVPKKAPLFITADQSYQLYLNGAFVGRGPARGFQSHWPFDEIDVARWLVPGRNVIAVRAHNPGRSNFQYLTQGYAGLLVAAKWGRTKIESNQHWQCVPQPGIKRDATQCGHQLFDQEHYDARVGIAGWMNTDFNDSDWLAPVERPHSCLPWSTLEPRGIPQMFEEASRPGTVIGTGRGTSGEGWREARNLFLLRQEEDHSHTPVKDSSGSLATSGLEVPQTGRGKFRSYLIDMGRPVVGSLSLRVGGGHGGETIDVIYTEVIEADTLEPVMTYPSSSRATFSSRLICRPGLSEHRYYHPFGFRYATLTVRESTTPLHISVTLHRTGYPVERRGAFRSSDPMLEQIWETCAWSQQNCMLDAYVDTPWREQAQWWGDARVQAWNTFHLNGDSRLFQRGIRQIGAQTTDDGVTYGHSPTMAHNCVLPDFTLIWIITMWDNYWQTGDLDLFRSQRPIIARALTYFEDHTGKDGLVTYDDRYWLFLDWTELFKEGAPTIYNLWLVLALEKLAELDTLTKNKAEAARSLRWASKLRQRLRKLIDRRGLLRDGIDAKGRIVKSTSPHAQTMALMTNLEPKSAAKMERFLVDYLRDESKHTSQPSAYWITYVYTVLAERGQGRAVLEHIRPNWEPMVAQGSTSEMFTDHVEYPMSHSHAWSAHPLFHFMQIIGGVRQIAPVWKRISFAPVFYGDHGGATIPTPQGDITSAWQRDGDRIAVSLDLPQGVTATVALPGIRLKRATGRSEWIVAAG